MKEALKQIIEQAEAKGACIGQLSVAKRFYAEGKITEFWQVVLGSRCWAKDKGIDLPDNLEALAKNIGKVYRADGSVVWEATYANGERHGVCKCYRSDGNGSLEWERTYANGERHGVRKRYNADGSVWREDDLREW